MEDSEIIALYWRRDEAAVGETRRKYGRYLAKIARNILSNREDGEEIVNDACLKAWNSIPPNRPDSLAAYLGKIARRLSIDALRTRTREKRAAAQYALSLSELEECLPGGAEPEQQLELSLLAQAVNAYLRTLAPQARNLFIGRYFYMDSLKEAAAYCGMSESKAKSMLYRVRQGLKTYLKQEGFRV